MAVLDNPHNHRTSLANEAADLYAAICGYAISISEGVWDGSHHGHDPDFQKIKGGLKKYWIAKMRTLAHPHAYCVRHLRKHVANPERLCAWLKDQALNTTKWRNQESIPYEPTIAELKSALRAFSEAEKEIEAQIGATKEAGNSGGTSSEVAAVYFTESGKRFLRADGTEITGD